MRHFGNLDTNVFTEIENRYAVYICGGDDDGKEIFHTDLEIDAINYCINHDHEHPLGCTIVDEYTGEIVDNY